MKEKNMLNQVVFFQTEDVIREIKAVEPSALTLLGGRPSSTEYQYYLDAALEHDHDILSVRAQDTNAQVVSDIQSKGFPVFASYLTSIIEWRSQSLFDEGMDMLLTDDVAVSMGVLNRKGFTQVTPFDLDSSNKIKQISKVYFKENDVIREVRLYHNKTKVKQLNVGI